MDIDIRDYLEKLDCEKIVNRSPYERPDPSSIVWWNTLFGDLEEKFQLPNYKKKRIVNQFYSRETLEEFERIGLELREESSHEIGKGLSEVVVDNRRQKELDKQGILGKVKFERKCIENPYRNFMLKSPRDAQIWRPKKSIALESLSLIEKANEIKGEIASDFDQYLRSLGGQKKVNLDKDIILELFAIHSDLPAEKSLCKKGKDLLAVPQAIADLSGKQKFSERNRIKKEISEDLNIKGKNTTSIAFGKSLPLRLRITAKPKDIQSKWMGCYVYHEELADMTKAFDDITELIALRGFCKWLLKHPEIPRAKFLQDKGLFDLRLLNRKVISAYQIFGESDNFNSDLHAQSLEEYNKLVQAGSDTSYVQKSLKSLTKNYDI